MHQRRSQWFLLLAYGCSGFAGLVYQVTWTRLLTLYMGHSTAAVSTVVAAFMAGLGGGSILGGRLAGRLGPRLSLISYAALEVFVMVVAFALPTALTALTPALAWAYQDGVPGATFPSVRLLSCLALLVLPALALGATFPLAARWYVGPDAESGRDTGVLYAANTIGAAVGAALAGFVLLPAFGISGTTLFGMAAGALAVLGVLLVIGAGGAPTALARAAVPPDRSRVARPARVAGTRRTTAHALLPPPQDDTLLAAVVLALTGFATFTLEIAWARVLSQVFGPTTYAFAATVSILICGMAGGSMIGAWIARRPVRLSLWLALALGGTAAAASVATSVVGAQLPRWVAAQVAASPILSGTLLGRHIFIVAALLLPASVGLGLAFPLALAHIRGDAATVTRRLGGVFGVNTLAAVAGALASGFVLIPLLGLQRTLGSVSVLLAFASGAAMLRAGLSRGATIGGIGAAAAVCAATLAAPSWDRDLLSSGLYKAGSATPPGLDVEAVLKAGTLLYFRDGAAATVSVRRLTGALSLSIDGKVDASTSGDMLTQRALAHVPLLLHPNPRRALVIGLGSGVTLGSALVHPLSHADVVEISPEVVEASRYFAAQSHRPLEDPRTRLVVGDGRLHLRLATTKYDVIVSEPSNPWMSGVAALFTREFFEAARNRLAPGGIICQWAHTYDISPADLRSIVATFLSVFPQGTLWLIGQGDVLLVASDAPLDDRLDSLARSWARPGVAADLREVGVSEPFGLLSAFGGGPNELSRFAAGAELQTDDRMGLEFSGPRSLSTRGLADNATALHGLQEPDQAPPAVRRALLTAGATQWRDLGAMLFGALTFDAAYDAYLRAVKLDPSDAVALDGLVRAALAANRRDACVAQLRAWMAEHQQNVVLRLAASKLLAAAGALEEAVALATEAAAMTTGSSAALDQLASLFADFGDAGRLDEAIDRLRQVDPAGAHLPYYMATSQFLRGRLDQALPLAQRAVEQAPALVAAHNLLGALYARTGQRDAARQAFEAALVLDAENAVTYANLGLLALETADGTSAARYFTEALLLDPTSSAARDGLARSREVSGGTARSLGM